MPRNSGRRSTSKKPVVDLKNKTVKVGNKKYELLAMKNGALYFNMPIKKADGSMGSRPRIVSGAAPEYMSKIRSKSRVSKRRSARRTSAAKRKSLDKKKASAGRAFVKYYSNKRFSSERARKIAMTKDLREGNQNVTRSLRKYRKNPGKYDMVGVDAKAPGKTIKDLKKQIRASEKHE